MVMMKVKQSQATTRTSLKVTAMDKNKTSSKNPSKKSNSDKSERRKSGAFRGLSLRPFGTESTTNKDTENQAEGSSLLKRFGVRRSSKKKAKKSSSKSSDSNADMSDSKPRGSTSSEDGVKSKDAGNTPKLQRIQRVNQNIHSTPWGSDDSSDEENQKKERPRRSNSLRATGKKLKRSMSLICGASRSKVLQTKSEFTRSTMNNDDNKRRRSIGMSLANYVNKRVTKVATDTDCDAVQTDKQNSSLLDNSHCCSESFTSSGRKKISSLSRRLSENGVLSSAKKWRLKRNSYERMNYERDCSSPALKRECSSPALTKIIQEKEPMRSPPKRTRSLKRTLSGFKLGNKRLEEPSAELGSHEEVKLSRNTAEKPISRKASLRRSERCKSMGVPATPNDRRTSGVYANTNTPTFMTCGYIMTDSPPDSYLSSDLQWVTLKRKRRSEAAGSKINRYNAGHTPLPPRKKRCSYGERLIE